MPNTQKKITLGAKSAASVETRSPNASQASLQSFFGQDEDSLVKKITTEVLKGVEASFDKKVDPVLKKLEECASRVVMLDKRVTEAECRISDSEDTLASHTTKLAEVEGKLEAALDKIDDLENRGRRCNIRIIGLPEGSEGSNPLSFFKTWLPELLQASFKGGSIKLDRCHRSLARRPQTGQRPRAVIVKFHNFQDKLRIMQAARKAQTLEYKGAKIMIFEDFSAAVVRKRQEFNQVKQQLKENGVEFAMLYPAILRIRDRGMEKFFKHPKEAAIYLGKIIRPEEPPNESPPAED